jgi:hypothetical protein
MTLAQPALGGRQGCTSRCNQKPDRKMTKLPPGAKFFEEVTRLRTINGQLPVAQFFV